MKKEDEKLISAFVQAQKEIEHYYLQALREKNLTKAKHYAQKAQMLVDTLQEDYQERSLSRNAQAYLQGFKQVEHLKRGTPKRTLELGEDQILLQVWKLHTQALHALIQSSNRPVLATLDGVKKDIVYSLALFGQKEKEAWLQHQIQSRLGAWLLTGKALHTQKSDLVAFFQKKGLALRDRSWRKRNPNTYAEMLIRTETARAYNAGMINRALELWTSKFKIEESWNCCSICASHNGKIVDLKQWSYELPPFHPNCRGTIVPVWEWEASRFWHEIDDKVRLLAQHTGIEGKNTLEKMKRLNKFVKKWSWQKTDLEKAIYQLKDQVVLKDAEKSKTTIYDKWTATTYKIKQDGIQVNWHLSKRVYKELVKRGIIKRK